jgi:DeoR/GlpR family transcriptional regulator of sugar metabolism
MDHARQVILLADSSKAGKVSFANAGRWEDIHLLITDRQVDKQLSRELLKRGVRIVKT